MYVCIYVYVYVSTVCKRKFVKFILHIKGTALKKTRLSNMFTLY